jgi:hypothetical protein
VFVVVVVVVIVVIIIIVVVVVLLYEVAGWQVAFHDRKRTRKITKRP